jgi:2,3-bisphosphoglycerate-dependent phosphoglycerate mutase
MGRLILVRHGRTVLNTADDAERLRGWLEVPLDEQGLREAEETAQHVAKYPVAQIYTSDLLRARQTAAAVVAATGAPVFSTLNLRPWNVGRLAGRRVAEILPILQRLERDPSLPAPGGESFLHFYERYTLALQELMKIATRAKHNIVVVTHVRNLLATPTILYGGNKANIPVHGGPKTGSLTWIEQHATGWTLRVEDVAPCLPGVISLNSEPIPTAG